ncbi:inorganic phosphate transporter [Prevotella sp. MGM1]|nr:inorganic phosphate transporter [Prevotella sp. MGM1]
MYAAFQFRSHEGHILYTFKKQEVYYSRGGDTAEKPYFPLHRTLISEREYHSRDKLHNRAEEKSDGHRKEYTEYDRQRFLRIQQIIYTQVSRIADYLHDGNGKRGTEQLKDKRNGSGRGQPH